MFVFKLLTYFLLTVVMILTQNYDMRSCHTVHFVIVYTDLEPFKMVK